MSTKRFAMFLIVAFCGGLIGGFLAGKTQLTKEALTERSPASSATGNKTQSKAKKIIEAEEFRVVDGKGNICARLMSETDTDGETIAKLDLGPSVPMIYMTAGGEKCDIHLAYPGGYLWLEGNKQTNASISLHSDENGYGNDIMLRTGGEPGVLIDRYKWPDVKVLRPQEIKRLLKPPTEISHNISLKVLEDIIPVLEMRDRDKKARAVLGQTQLRDKTGSTIIRPPSSLVLLDEKGQMVWSAP